MRTKELARKPSGSSRQTRQRALIYRIVASTERHPTADWVYEQARRQIPNVSLGTVYRNLQVLEREGRIRSLGFLGRATRYDADLSDHYHFVCGGCGAIFDMEKPEDGDARVGELLREREFTVTGHRLEFRGLCPDCRSAGAEIDANNDRRIERRK
jgi:Fur family peroxide stress response transcriptional regulator